MKSGHDKASRSIARTVLGGVWLAAVVSGCGSSASDPGSIGALPEGLRGGDHGGPSHRHHSRHHGNSNGGNSNGGGGNGGGAVQACGPQDQDQLFTSINEDLLRLDAADRPFTRYLSLADRAHLVGCGAALDGERAALNELINSVSLDARLSALVPVDADRTLYRIDLRNFGFDRPLVVNGKRSTDAWEALIAESPYALPYVGDDADQASAATRTTVPVLFGDAFVAAAARAPLYYALLDIPANADDFLLNDLGIDLGNSETARAGFEAAAQGGTASFLAQRADIEVRSGVAWQISEFGDLFDDPLGDADGEREIVFTLPNGLQGHILADANGRVTATSNALVDVTESDFRAHIATSFFRSRAGGVQLTDQVRDFARANPDNFSAADLAAIRAAYPGQRALQQILDADRAVFSTALQRLGLDIATAPEPVSQSFSNFDADVDLATAAADLLISPEDLRQNLSLLDPVFSVLGAQGGKIDRDDFNTLYRGAACIFTTVLENQVDPKRCP
jgi:hypothetical protein